MGMPTEEQEVRGWSRERERERDGSRHTALSISIGSNDFSIIEMMLAELEQVWGG